MRRSVLLATVALVFVPATMGAVSSATITGQTTTSFPLGASRQVESAGCHRSQSAVGRPSVLSVSLVRLGTGAVALAGVCIDESGPFPFLIDSGSSLSVVSAQLSRRVHLPPVAAPENAAGIGCSTTVVREEVSSWSIGGLTLKPEVVLSTAVPKLGTSQPLAGVIGSDVLSRFGSVRIDYRAGTMSLGDPESASPTSTGVLQGPRPSRTPAQFLTGVLVDAALTVVSSQSGVAVYAPVRFDGAGTHPFLVDTGAEVSMVSSPLAHLLHLAAATQRVALPAAFGCPVHLSEVHSGPWALGSASLAPQLIARLPASGLTTDGVLGSDVLSRYGAVVIDYRGARMLLESG